MSVVNEIWNPYKVYKENESVLFTAIVYTVKVGQISSLGVPPPVAGSVIWTGAGGGGGGASGATISAGNSLITVTGTPTNYTIAATPITIAQHPNISLAGNATTIPEQIGVYTYTPTTSSSSIMFFTPFQIILTFTSVLSTPFSLITTLSSSKGTTLYTNYFPITSTSPITNQAILFNCIGYDTVSSLTPVIYKWEVSLDVYPVELTLATVTMFGGQGKIIIVQTPPIVVPP